MHLKQKKIIFVVPSLKGGGAERVATTLLESFRKSEPELELFLVLFGEEVCGESGFNIRCRYLHVHERGSLLYTVFKFFKIIIQLARIFKEESPSAILSFMDYSNIVSIVGNYLSGKRARVVISVHTKLTALTRQYSSDKWERSLGVLIKRLYNHADSVVAVSRDVADDLEKNFGIDRNLIQVISNPFDLKKIRCLSEEHVMENIFKGNIPIILSVGRLSSEKNVGCLVKAFSLLKADLKAALVILGEGEEEQYLKQLCRDLGIEKNVFFLGYKDNPFKYMKRSTVFALSSFYEGFGNVIVEAMACGLPVVATRSYESIEDIIENDRNGLIVPVAEEKALADALLRLLNNPEVRERYISEAMKKVECYRSETIAAQYGKVLRDL
ncbi:MAG: glycosyltransferase [Nitrospirae bacterium]|nr:glycosyltransferase [Nitrospirota bacterium]